MIERESPVAMIAPIGIANTSVDSDTEFVMSLTTDSGDGEAG